MDVYGPFQINKIHRLEDYLSISGIVLEDHHVWQVESCNEMEDNKSNNESEGILVEVVTKFVVKPIQQCHPPSILSLLLGNTYQH